MNLIGNDFTDQLILQWYRDEAAYHDQFVNGRSTEYSVYDDAVNQRLFFNEYLESGSLLDFGCAEGLILKRFLSRSRNISLKYYGVDSSESLINAAKSNVKEGIFVLRKGLEPLPFGDGMFDYIVVSSVLHHIPDVTRTLDELVRCLKSGGLIFLKEPITDMKKLDGSRPGLSPHERGIPVGFFSEYARENHMLVLKMQLFGFGPLNYARKICPKRLLPYLACPDFLLSGLFSFVSSYRRETLLSKFGPTAAGVVLRKG